MKRILLLVGVAFVPMAHAGVIGWFTSEARDWQFIQRSGGIRIGVPIERAGRRVLPVDYWPEGNSGLVVRKIELNKRGAHLVIRVFTQVVEKDSDTSRTHYVDLSTIGGGAYEVYYEAAGDPLKHLGRIEIK
jgi:hypothetical protein